MINLLGHAHRRYHHIRLNHSFSADLWWWRTFISAWNGVSVFPPCSRASIEFTSDASGLWGCGAWCGTAWFQFQWPQHALQHHITFLELVAVVLACVAWGSRWGGRSILCWCDNAAVVQVIASRSCRDPGLMHLLRCLFFVEAVYQFQLSASHIRGRHIRGRDNTLADDLSRDRLSSFRSMVPQADLEPTKFPEELPQLLFRQDLDWTSPTWTRLFTSIVAKD